MRFPGFIGPSYVLKSFNVECQRCINLYPEIDEAGTEKDGGVAALIGTPGLKFLNSVGPGPIRGMYLATTNVVYFVSGSAIYVMDQRLQPIQVGAMLTNQGPVSMVDNGISIFMVDNPNGYFGQLSVPDVNVLGNSHTVVQTSDPNWQGSTQVSLVDGYFIFNKPNTFEFYVTNLLSTTINPQGFATKESPDYIVGHASDHRNLWLFGSKTTEVWYNAGVSPGVPFQIIQGSYMEIGCAAAFSIAQLANSLIWLGQDPRGAGIVYMTQGYQPRRISNHSVELAIQSYGPLGSAWAWTYEQNGHQFYCLNFPQADTTWVFDVATEMWHERAGYSNGLLTRHRVGTHVAAFGQHLVGDFQSGKLYRLDENTYTDNEAPIVRRRASPHVSAGMKWIFYSKFQLDFQPGVGIQHGLGTDPQVILQWSDDGGHTWSFEYRASLGRVGKTEHRAIWRRLGKSRNRVYRVTISDPVEVIMIGAELDAAAGTS